MSDRKVKPATLLSAALPANGGGDPAVDRLRRGVQDILASAEFVRSARMIRFLTYIAEQTLKTSPQVSERQIGVAVFDRSPDWDPKVDPTVRIEARRLRKKLAKYYSTVEDEPDVVLFLPKGSYRLEHELRSAAPQVSPDTAVSPLPQLQPQRRTLPVSNQRRFRIGAWWVAGVTALVLLVLAVKAAHRNRLDVAEDQSIQLGAITVMPDVALRETGGVLAGVLADQIRRLQSKTRISWAAQAVEDVWTNESPTSLVARITRKLNAIAQEDDSFRKVPAQISGYVKNNGQSTVELYVRGKGIAPRSFIGKASGVNDILAAAAEYIYSQCQPAAFAVYLNEHGRFAEAIPFAQQHYARAVSAGDKLQFLFSWGMALDESGNPAAAAAIFRSCIELNPQSWGSLEELMVVYLEMGRAEQALGTGQLLESRAHRGSSFYDHLPSALFRPVRADTFIPVDELRHDNLAVQASLEKELAATAGAGIHQEGILPEYAATLARLHQLGEAGIELQIAERMPSSLPADIIKASLEIARQAGNVDELKARLSKYRSAVANPQKREDFGFIDEDLCNFAVLYNEAGEQAQAEVLVAGRRPSMFCLESEAEILSARGDLANAKSKFLQATAQGPHLPEPHYRFGLFLMAQGKLDDARRELGLARAYGPHWAEPAKALGELDLRTGDTRAAMQEFESASRYAPKWANVYSEWGTALLRAGRKDEGEVKLRLARSLK